MRLPDLSALRLAEAGRRVDTDVWIKYELPDDAKRPNEEGDYEEDDKLNDDPDHYDGIHQYRFYDGQWIWKTEDNQGRVRYDPRSYWQWLDGEGKGKDPFSREPIPKSELEELLKGPPEDDADRSRDRVQLAEPSEADTILERWKNLRSGNAGATPPALTPQEVAARANVVLRPNPVPAFEFDEDDGPDYWDPDVLTELSIRDMEPDSWFRRLMVTGLELEEIRDLRLYGRTEDAVAQVQRLGIGRPLLDHLESLGGSNFAWYMPFCGDRHGSEPWGVRYQWRPIQRSAADEFVISATMPAKSDLASTMIPILKDFYQQHDATMSGNTPFDQFLRGRSLADPFLTGLLILHGLLHGSANATQYSALPRPLYDRLMSLYRHINNHWPRALRCVYRLLSNDSESTNDWDLELRISINPKLMLWLCRVRSGNAPTPLPSAADELPLYAHLDTTLFQTGADEWNSAQTAAERVDLAKTYWQAALHVMLGAIPGMLVNLFQEQRVYAVPKDARIFSSPGYEQPVKWKLIDDNPNEGYSMLEVRELLWYGVAGV